MCNVADIQDEMLEEYEKERQRRKRLIKERASGKQGEEYELEMEERLKWSNQFNHRLVTERILIIQTKKDEKTVKETFTDVIRAYTE